MNNLRLSIFSAFLLFSCVSCAQEKSDENNIMDDKSHSPTSEVKRKAAGSFATGIGSKVKQKDSGDILVLVEDEKGFFEGSYISMSHGGPSVKAQRVMEVLKDVGADSDFISRIGPRIESNRRLKKENFNLPLTDEEGSVHRFEYITDDENGLYTLNYSFMPMQK